MGLLRIITIPIPRFALRASRGKSVLKINKISSIENLKCLFSILFSHISEVFTSSNKVMLKKYEKYPI